ncbi:MULTISPECIES: lipopolysaccharide assembly protein LapB [Staphylococcus]|uniref:tetratricopeptide repeat protein n=1 Tax=Staphylococcus TaxID=1279 RepID=UPI00076B424C|nr:MULTISPECIES: tetratricopeptide repeat protein [Staphylococcus]AMG63278.1 tetratricopeptide repeat protein [Staphylococcus lugdunensis]MCI2815548.1 tetratricopeptide repeat protein [Staphylococcus lugdunensis]MDU0965128.1 tetratricopeptide repeat protein [Staphylococcus lugdunensis]MDU0995720.1 tetratricopeptide repeat protein [Staphylococcus lugdunensis]MDU1963871.1 tetratricopeptide repeat protein [Staphylococcus lugdunensis]
MTEQEQIYQYIQKGQRDKALKALFNNIEENPNVIENYINAGIILADIGEIVQAEKFFQRALTIDDTNGAIYYNLANIYYNQGRFNEAIKLYQKSLKYHMDMVDCNYMIGMAFNQLEAFKEALPYLMTAAEKDENRDSEIQFQYGLVLCQLEMFEQAIQQLKYVLQLDSSHTDALYNLGLAIYMKTEDIDTAISYFERAIAIDPKHLLSQHAKATFLSMKNKED